MQTNDTRSDSEPEAVQSDDAPPAAASRAEAYRERFRQAQIVAAQVARARTAGGPPNDDQAARMIAEFHARGGKTTVCPESDDVSLNG